MGCWCPVATRGYAPAATAAQQRRPLNRFDAGRGGILRVLMFPTASPPLPTASHHQKNVPRPRRRARQLAAPIRPAARTWSLPTSRATVTRWLSNLESNGIAAN